MNDQLKILVQASLAANAKETLDKQLSELKLKSIKINVSINKDSIKNAIKNAQNTTKDAKSPQLEIFDIDKLDKEGRKYYLNATNIIDRIKKEFQNAGDINIVDTRNANKQLTGFTVEIRKLSGEIEKLNFKKAQFSKQGWGSKQSGFVFEKSSDTDKLLGTDLQKKLDVLNRFNNALATIKQRAFDLTKPISNQTHIDSLNKRYEAIKTEIDKVRLSGEAMSKSQQRHISNMIASADRLRKKYQELERPAKVLESKTLEQTMAGYKTRFFVDEERWRQQGILVGDFQKRVDALKVAMSAVGSKTDLHKFQVELESVKAEAKKLNLEIRQFNKETAQMTASNKLSTYLRKNPKAFKNDVEGFTKLRDSIKDIDTVTKQSQFNKEFTRLKTNIEALAKSGKTAFGSLAANMKKFFGWLISSGAVMTLVSTLKNMVNRVIDLDTQMTALRKVTDETSETYARFFNGAADSAQKLGTTMSALIKSTGDFARLGYGLEDAKALAEVANIYQNVGDIDIGSATESIISTLKAFNIEATNSIEIVDKFNEVNKPAPLRLVA